MAKSDNKHKKSVYSVRALQAILF